jgi:hypothetical protein
MAKEKPAQQPRVYQATRASLGKVVRGAELTVEQAIVERKAQRDIVVCGGGTVPNRVLAGQIENAVGPATRPQAPHTYLGPYALPHFQQEFPPPQGHSFYETDQRKAAKNP